MMSEGQPSRFVPPARRRHYLYYCTTKSRPSRRDRRRGPVGRVVGDSACALDGTPSPAPSWRRRATTVLLIGSRVVSAMVAAAGAHRHLIVSSWLQVRVLQYNQQRILLKSRLVLFIFIARPRATREFALRACFRVCKKIEKSHFSPPTLAASFGTILVLYCDL